MPPFLMLLLALLGLPVVDILLLFWVGGVVGSQWTLGLVFLGLILGLSLCSSSRMMTAPWAAGVLLALPGFLTDLAAIALLVPPLRQWLLLRLLRGWTVRVGPLGGVFPGGAGPGAGGDAGEDEEHLRGKGSGPGGAPQQGGERVRDAEFRVLPRSSRSETPLDES